MLKRRVIDPRAVVNEPGQPNWMRVGDVFARELKKWRWERFMVKWGVIGGVMAALALMVLMKPRAAAERDLEKERLQEVERERRMAYAQSPEGKAEAEHQRERMIAYWKTPEGQAKRKSMEQAAKAAEAKRAASVDLVKVSAWDGSVEEAKAFIRRSVADPSAVKFNDWRHIVNDVVHVVRVDFTGVNAVGGPVRLNWAFTFQKQSGKLILVADGERILHKDY